MTQAIERLAPPVAGSPERRKVSRSQAWAEVTLCSSHGDLAEVTLADISTHGCSIRVAARWPRAGMFVSLRLTQGEPLQAIVRWVRDGAAGLEFLRPVPVERTEWHALIDSPYGF